MEIIKKNIVLFSVLTVTFVVSAVLAYFIFVEHGRMNDYINETNELKDKINDLNKQKIAPVAENERSIQRDRKKYIEKVQEIHLVFGRPFQVALTKFAEELGLALDDLKQKFKDFCAENVRATTSYDQIFIKFKRQFEDQAKWDKAWEVFKVEAQKHTSEKIDSSNADAIFLLALGLHRDLSILKSDSFRQKARIRLLDILDKAKISYTNEASYFSFDFKQLPSKYDIPLIIQNWSIIDDIVSKRVAASGISWLEKFEKRRLSPEEEGDYAYFRYTLTVKGSLESIKKLVNNFSEAYNESRVYVVRSIELNKVVDQAAEILGTNGGDVLGERRKEMTNNEFGHTPVDMPPDFGGVPMPGAVGMQNKKEAAEKLDKEKEEAEKDLPFDKRESYAQVVIGASAMCTAVIDIDYVRYKANDVVIGDK